MAGRHPTPELVLLHGFTNTGASWAPVVAALGRRYRTYTPDIRGHGGATERRPVELDVVLADIGALTPAPFALGGYSMGGRIALHAALALPERVRSLVLVGASPGLADGAERAARRAADERLAEEVQRSTQEEFAARWARTPVLSGLPPALATQVHADRLRSTPAGLAAALRGLGTGALPSLWDRLPELTMPVALVAGERDEKFRAVAVEMAQRIPHAEVTVVPGAGHAAHIERPGEIAQILDAAIGGAIRSRRCD